MTPMIYGGTFLKNEFRAACKKRCLGIETNLVMQFART